MIFLDDASAEFAGGEFYKSTGSAFYASDEKLAGDYSPVRYQREIRLLHQFSPRGRVLDVGCSTGGFLYHLRQRFPSCYDVIGTDVAVGALDVAEKNGIPILRENFLSTSAGRGPFDAISFWAVLEHVADPRQFVQQARALLAPGGQCFALVPNIESLAMRLLGRKYRYILPQHLNYFSVRTLRRLFESHGFAVVYSSATHFNPIVILQDARSRSGLVPDRERAKLLVKTNALKANPLLKPARWIYQGMERLLARAYLADNIVIVARPR